MDPHPFAYGAGQAPDPHAASAAAAAAALAYNSLSMLAAAQSPYRFVLRKPYRSIEREYALEEREPLGTGQYGVIRSCIQRRSGKSVACKTISKGSFQCPEDAEAVGVEVAILELLQGNNHIVRLHDTFEDAKNVHIVMEICRGGDLLERVRSRGPYEERAAAHVIKALAEALLCCHRNGVLHRDVKPENVLLCSPYSDTKVKLIDFGVATFMEPGMPCIEFVGTPMYIAPEVIIGPYGPPADMWSVGVVLFIILSGVPPFWASTNDAIFALISKGDISFSSNRWNSISAPAKDLVLRLLTKEPSRRLTAIQVLEHPWIRQLTSR